MRGADLTPKHFLWTIDGKVATLTLNRPEKKNPLTFESYAELRDTFRTLKDVEDVKTIVITGAGENFCSGGDVNEIIGPLLDRDLNGLREFTHLTGDVIIGMLTCPQVIVAAIDGVCVGAGAALAMASDLRFGTERSKIAFLFVKVGLAGCDMGVSTILPRIIGHGRAAELLYTGRALPGPEALAWGFYNQMCDPGSLLEEATSFARKVADGPTFSHHVTKQMLVKEWDMNLIDAIRAEAEAQAICMDKNDFRRAYEAFVKKEKPKFEGD